MADLALFSCQGADLKSAVAALSAQRPHSPLLDAFIAAAVSALAQDANIPAHALNLVDLALSSDPASQGALLCLVQLARLFARCQQLPRAVFSSAVGFCTGILPAAAALSASSSSELLANAVDAVRLAYLLGQVSHENTTQSAATDFSNAATTNASKPSWSLYLSVHRASIDVDLIQARIDAVNTRLAPDASIHPLYVSAVSSASALTVSGHPSLLDVLHANLRLDPLPNHPGLRLSPLAIYSPYHSHIIGPSAVDRAIWLARDRKLAISRQPHLALEAFESIYQLQPSPSLDGSVDHDNSDLDRLHRCIFRAVLECPLHWDDICDRIVAQLLGSDGDHKQFRIAPYGPGALGLASTLASRAKITHPTLSVLVDPDPDSFAIDSQDPASSMAYPHDDDEIAIVSAACRFPGNIDSPSAFFDSLTSSSVYSKPLEQDTLFNATEYSAANLLPPGLHHYPVENVDLFDARLFNISPKEAEQLDPTHRLAILTAYEALERAGYSPDIKPSFAADRMAVWFGAMADDYRENASDNIGSYFITGNIRAFIPGRISFYFEWQGPSNSVDTAESSSITSIESAVLALRAGQCDTALAGAVSISTQPQIWIAFCRDGILDRAGIDLNSILPDSHQGVVRGNGCGVLLLKRLRDAIRDNDTVLATIPAVSTAHLPSIPPHLYNNTSVEEFQNLRRNRTTAIEKNLETLLHECNSSVDPSRDVAAVEYSGWFEATGEADEVAAISSVLLDNHRAKNDIFLGNVRPNVGATEAASGIASVIKAIGIVKNGVVPPLAGLLPSSKTNHEVTHLFQSNSEQGSKLVLPSSSAPLNSELNVDSFQRRRKAVIVNSLAYSGVQGAVVIREAPSILPRVISNDKTPCQIITLSAKTPASLEGLKKKYLEFLSNPGSSINTGERSIIDLSIMTTARRIQHPLRLAASFDVVRNPQDHNDVYVSASVQNIINALENAQLKGDKGDRKKKPLALVYENFDAVNNETLESLVVELSSYSMAIGSVVKNIASLTRAAGFPQICKDVVEYDPDYQPSSDRYKNVVAHHTLTLAVQLGIATLLSGSGLKADKIVGKGSSVLAALVYDEILQIEDAVEIANLLDFNETDTTTVVKDVIEDLQVEMQQAFTDARNEEGTSMEWIDPTSSAVISSAEELVKLISRELTVCANASDRLNSPPLSPTLGKNNSKFSVDITSAHWLSVSAARSDLVPEARAILGENSILTAPVTWKSICAVVSDLFLSFYDINWKGWYGDMLNDARLVGDLPTYSFDLSRYWMEYKDRCLLPIPGEEDEESDAEYSDDAELYTPEEDIMDEDLSRTTPYPLVATCLLTSSPKNDEFSLPVYKTKVHSPLVLPLISGHSVHQKCIVAATTWSETALEYIHDVAATTRPDLKSSVYEVSNVDIVCPLILGDAEKGQIMRIEGSIKQQQNTTEFGNVNNDNNIVNLTFGSYEDPSGTITDSSCKARTHLTCSVAPVDEAAWFKEWNKISTLIHARMDELKSGGAMSSKVSTVGTRMAYKLFQVAVDYEKIYQGMRSVTFDSETSEATTTVKLNKNAPKGNYVVHPCLGDSLGQISGFISNVGNKDPDSTYIANFIESIRYSTRFLEINAARNNSGVNRVLHTYCSMKPDAPEKPTAMIGDVFIMEDSPERPIIAAMYGIKFKRVPIKVFETLLGVSKSKKASAKTSAAKSSGGTMASAPKMITRKVKKLVPKSTLGGGGNSGSSSSATKAIQTLKDVVAQELSISVSELHPHANFAELGLDSLLSIVILGSLRDMITELELPASLFQDYPTMQDVEDFFKSKLGQGNSSSTNDDDEMVEIEVEEQVPVDVATNSKKKKVVKKVMMKKSGSNGGSGGKVTSSMETVKEHISRELGIDNSELHDHANFAELGLDSLLSIVILGGLRDEIDIELPASMFQDYATIKELRSFFVSQFPNDSSGEGEQEEEVEIEVEVDDDDDYGFTPDQSSMHLSSMSQSLSHSAVAESASNGLTEAMEKTREILIAELSLDNPAELTSHVELAHLGLDSLMALVIRGRLDEELPFEVPQSLFMDATTLKEVEEIYSRILPKKEPSASPPMPISSTPAATSSPSKPTVDSSNFSSQGQVNQSEAKSHYVVKGTKPICLFSEKNNATNATKKPIFLVPDGSGNAACYANFTSIDRPFYVINSPFVRDSAEWVGGMTQLAKCYIASMKMIQPSGPYIVGGWSYGGIVSYEVARILADSPDPNDRCAAIVLLDSPSPRMAGLPVSIGDYVYNHPTFNMPVVMTPTLMGHFVRSCTSHDEYTGPAWDKAKPQPKAILIAAGDGLGGGPEDVPEYNETVEWIMKQRSDNAVGWDKLLGQDNVTVLLKKGCHHFNLVQVPFATGVSNLIKDACEQLGL